MVPLPLNIPTPTSAPDDLLGEHERVSFQAQYSESFEMRFCKCHDLPKENIQSSDVPTPFLVQFLSGSFWILRISSKFSLLRCTNQVIQSQNSEKLIFPEKMCHSMIIFRHEVFWSILSSPRPKFLGKRYAIQQIWTSRYLLCWIYVIRKTVLLASCRENGSLS